MANKYNYPTAYFNVYLGFWSMHGGKNLDSLDTTTRNIALEYLKKGAELGEINSMSRLGTYYFEGKYFEQDTIFGKELKDNAYKSKITPQLLEKIRKKNGLKP